MIDALCFMLCVLLGLMGLCLAFVLLILAGGAACRFYEWIKYDVMKGEERE